MKLALGFAIGLALDTFGVRAENWCVIYIPAGSEMKESTAAFCLDSFVGCSINTWENPMDNENKVGLGIGLG